MALLQLALLIIAIVFIIQVVQSKLATGKKVIWILVILFLPIVGPILWYLLGKKS